MRDDFFNESGQQMKGDFFNEPDEYLGTFKRPERLAKTYVVKRFGEKYDFMAHAHFVLCFVLLNYSVLNFQLYY